ncbi:hypothetical protein EMIT0162MI3_11211 [Pseudomonas chlororaphis]
MLVRRCFKLCNHWRIPYTTDVMLENHLSAVFLWALVSAENNPGTLPYRVSQLIGGLNIIKR